MSTTSHWLPKFCGCWLRRRCTVASDRPHESDLRGSRRPADSRFSEKHQVVSQSPGPVLESERVRRSTIADSCVDGDINYPVLQSGYGQVYRRHEWESKLGISALILKLRPLKWA